ncbi:MAG: response regulator [Bacteroidota bacterium]
MTTSIKIVLADDDADDRFLFESALREVNKETQLITADCADDLLLILDKQEVLPDLIMLDINMPGKNGLDCLQELRRSERFSSTPIAMFSTSIEDAFLQLASKKGADYFIKKPSSYSTLKKVVQFCLNIDGRRKENQQSFIIDIKSNQL